MVSHQKDSTYRLLPPVPLGGGDWVMVLCNVHMEEVLVGEILVTV